MTIKSKTEQANMQIAQVMSSSDLNLGDVSDLASFSKRFIIIRKSIDAKLASRNSCL